MESSNLGDLIPHVRLVLVRCVWLCLVVFAYLVSTTAASPRYVARFGMQLVMGGMVCRTRRTH